MIRNQAKSNNSGVRVGITHGDFNGVSYEIILKALNDSRIFEFFTPIIYGLTKVLSYNRKSSNLKDFNYKVIASPVQAQAKKVNIINLSTEEVKIDFGKSTPLAGKYALDALEKAVSDLKEHKIDILITAPINKANIQSERFNFPGHTDYFAHQFKVDSPLMLMVHKSLRVGTVTGHIPLRDVATTLTKELILKKIETLDASLKKDFAIQKPKIAVLGLNPHAGDKGVIGNEDIDIVQPAISESKKKGTLSFGPFPADGFFGSDEYKKYDGILAMYHDQGLTPFKVLAFDEGVNFTAGLPIIRTSPGHGTAYDKAGKNIASATSLRKAIYLAIDIRKNRKSFDEMNKNPLPTGLSDHRSNGNNKGGKRE